MRQLKKNEIVNKPIWAKSYSIQVQSDTPIFYSAEGGGAMPIPCEDFDIDEYDFSDTTICVANIGDEIIILQGEVHYDIVAESYVSLNKQDATALAKHFKLTAEDLR